MVFFQNKAFVTNMCFDEWNVNKQLTKVLKKSVLMLFTNLRVDPTREGAVRDVNRGRLCL